MNYYGSYYLNSFNELKSFEGLERLATIGGNFRISSEGNDKYMTFKKLSSLSNLTNLTNIGGNFEIYAPNYAIAQLKTIELPALKQINGYLYMRNNNQMNLIFENLEVLGSFNCWYFTTINIPKLQKINKDLYIGIGKDIRGLDFTYYGNEQTILDCFSTIRYVGGNLQINCSGIETFKPLKNLEFVGNNLYFDIGSDDSSMLQSFEGFDKLVTIGGSLIWGTGWTSNPYPTLVKNNFSNIQSFQGFNNLSSIGGFRMSINYGDFSKFTSFAGLENLRQIKGDFTIEIEDSFWGLSDISALTNLETVEGSEFKIKGCYKLKDFTPLKQALTSYQGTFSTYSNGYNPTKSQILNGEGKQ